MGQQFIVKTRDVDGGGSRKYKQREKAVKRFEEMLGYPIQNAIDEAYYMREPQNRPTPDNVMFIQGVSMFGTVVIFKAVEVQQ